MRILILDDDEERLKKFRANLMAHDVKTVTTSKETIAALSTESWDYLFLDHDLGGQVFVESGANTGYEVAVWLESHIHKKPKKIFIHSFNATGATKMMQALPGAQYIPGIWEYVDEYVVD